MERKSFLCLFFVVLLISPASILAETLEEVKETRNKRQAQILLPLASYAGMTVSAPLFAALVAAYGIFAVTRYAIRRGTLFLQFILHHNQNLIYVSFRKSKFLFVFFHFFVISLRYCNQHL